MDKNEYANRGRRASININREKREMINQKSVFTVACDNCKRELENVDRKTFPSYLAACSVSRVHGWAIFGKWSALCPICRQSDSVVEELKSKTGQYNCQEIILGDPKPCNLTGKQDE
jgi:hypothetical protein